MIVPALAALLASAATPATVNAVHANAVPGNAVPVSAQGSGATRFAGASVLVTISARIIRNSARVGAGLGPPAPRMHPRATTVTAANGAAVPALVYDFE